jgi:hypothetical protein
MSASEMWGVGCESRGEPVFTLTLSNDEKYDLS